MTTPLDLGALPLESLAALRGALIGPTLDYAARLPFYRRRWGTRWRDVRTVEALHRVPVLTKADAIRFQEALRTVGPTTQVGTISSGSMFGEQRPLRVVHSPAEAVAVKALSAALEARYGRAPPLPRGLRVLEVRSVHHGFPVEPPPPQRERVLWSHDAASFERLAGALAPRRGRPRFQGLVIGAGALMPLTLHLLERGIEPASFGLQVIGTTSFRLSAHWRAFLEETWQVRLRDNYSLSEFVTPASECPTCGFAHFELPPVVAQLVDPRSHRPARGPVGELVLTGLYPFVQAMPLVRYLTGDLVEWGPHCPSAGEPGLRWRGRLSQSLWGPAGRLWIAGGDVVESLEAFAEVARAPHPCEALGLVSSADAGPVKYALERRRGRARLEVEVRFDPTCFERRARALETAIARDLQARSPGLGAPLEVVTRRPGSLPDRWSKW